MSFLSSVAKLSETVPGRERKFGLLMVLYVFQSGLEILGLSSIIAIISGALGVNSSAHFDLIKDLGLSFSVLIGFSVLALLGKGLISIYCTYYQTLIAYTIQSELMTSMATSYLEKPLDSDGLSIGFRQTLLDSQQVAGGFSALGNLAGELLIFLVLFGLLSFVSPQIALVVIVFGGIAMLAIDVLIKPRVSYLGRQRQIIDDAKIDGFMNIAFNSVEANLFGVKKNFVDLAKDAADRYADVIARYSAYQVAPKRILEFFSLVGVLILFGWVTYAFDSEAEQVAMFASTSLILLRLMPSATRIMHTLTVMRYTTPVFKDFANRLESAKEKPDDQGFSFKVEKSGVVTYSCDSQGFNFSSDLVLKDSGLVWITGQSGIGKTTLLARLAAHVKSELGMTVGWVGQHPVTIPGSLSTNVSFFRDLTAAELSESEELFHSLGLQYLDKRQDLGHIGKGISGGEAQRLSLVRSLVRKPEKLFLDEPTSALDEANSEIVLQLLNRLSADIQIFVISHDDRFSSVAGEKIYIESA